MRAIGGHERSNYPVSLNVDDLGGEDGVDAGFSLNPQLLSPYEPERVGGYMKEHNLAEKGI